jgi:iron complex transport system substrate-binding protein
MELSEQLQERVDIIRHKLKFIEQKPAVACISQLEPLTLATSTVNEWVSIAGGAAITGDLHEQNPDIIILMLTGKTVEETIKEVNTLLQIPGFTDLKAVKNNRLYLTDGDTYFKTTDTGMVDSIEILAEIINPKQFIFGYEGEGWIRFEV